MKEAHFAVLEATEDIFARTVWSLAQEEVGEGHQVHPLSQREVATLRVKTSNDDNLTHKKQQQHIVVLAALLFIICLP